MLELTVKPETVSEFGKIQNKVGRLHIPEGDVKLSNGIFLKHQKTADIEDRGRDQFIEYAWWFGADKLKVIASLDRNPHGTLLHVSLSYPKRDPSWGVIKAVRYAFFPKDVDVAMMLPRDGDYVNVHPHCFQMWQTPEKWGLM